MERLKILACRYLNEDSSLVKTLKFISIQFLSSGCLNMLIFQITN